jgi:Family of unknown function (DUF5372)
LNELSTTPDNTNGEQSFTITHPFHPLCGQSFPLLSQRLAWGDERVFFSDPQTHELRSLPLACTNLALPDPFTEVAFAVGGKAGAQLALPTSRDTLLRLIRSTVLPLQKTRNRELMTQ